VVDGVLPVWVFGFGGLDDSEKHGASEAAALSLRVHDAGRAHGAPGIRPQDARVFGVRTVVAGPAVADLYAYVRDRDALIVE